MAYKHIVILTGAGISVESGIPPFRGENGLWTRDLIERIATPQGFNLDPEFAHGHYNAARKLIQEAEPNDAHRALAQLAAEYPGKVTIITQNVDDLHTRAVGNHPPKKGNALYYMHGELLKARKMRFNEEERRWEETGEIIDNREDITPAHPHVTDGRLRSLRPDIVMFDEQVKHSTEAVEAVNNCDLLVAIGTSGHVPPASSFPSFAKDAASSYLCELLPEDVKFGPSAHTIEINPDPTGYTHFDETIKVPASIAVPQLVDDLLREAKKAPWVGRVDRANLAPHRF